jgi:ribonuclease HII
MIIVGVDEVGRGALFGPVVACAYVCRQSKLENIKDSKKLTPQKRESIASKLSLSPEGIAYGLCDNKEIDHHNIHNATLLAMTRAVTKLSENIHFDKIMIDGLFCPDYIKQHFSYETVVKGDEKIYEIMSASILAKVYRDNLMLDMSKKFPQYGLDRNKGYATKEHLRRIFEIGPTRYHRMSFAPLNKL